MKPKTQDTYVRRIDQVVGYLNKQVESSHTLKELADIAGISPFHFHRVYRAITGETPSGTIRRLRLARAAVMLNETQKSITEIAFDVGYESSQAARACSARRQGRPSRRAPRPHQRRSKSQ